MSDMLHDEYAHYPDRPRHPWGVWAKRRQARVFFDMSGVAGLRGARVLECGPGDGYLGQLCKAAAVEYVGVEGSEAVAKSLRAQGYAVTHQKVPPLPQGIGEFDACFLLHVLEHMDSLEAARQLLELVRGSMRVNGKVIAACPDFDAWGDDFFRADPTHRLKLTNGTLRELAVSSGLRVLREQRYCGPVFGLLGEPLFWSARLLYWPAVERIARPRSAADLYYRGYLTLLPCILIVCESREGEFKG